MSSSKKDFYSTKEIFRFIIGRKSRNSGVDTHFYETYDAGLGTQ